MEDGTWKFLGGGASDGTTNLASDPRLSLMAACVANQQKHAGFGDVIDIREAKCPDCDAPGFNTGMGVWSHTCGAEWHSTGEPAERCPKGIEALNA